MKPTTTKPTEKTIADYYTNHPERWIRGSDHERGGRCCLRGASELIYSHQDPVYKKALPILNKRYGAEDYRASIITFNDVVAKDVYDIILLCHEAGV
jgi:hypothetical protein